MRCHDNRGAVRFDIKPGLDRIKAAGEDDACRLSTTQNIENITERRFVGLIRPRRKQCRHPDQVPHSVQAMQMLDKETGHALPCFAVVAMRIRPVGIEQIDVIDHLPRDVAVAIQTDNNRHIRSDNTPDRRQDLAFRVVNAVRQHRTVQVEHDGIDVCLLQPRRDRLDNRVEPLPHQCSARRRNACDQRHQLDVRLRLEHINHTADHHAAAAPLGQHGGIENKVEVVPLCRHDAERIGFMMNLADSDFHGA